MLRSLVPLMQLGLVVALGASCRFDAGGVPLGDAPRAERDLARPEASIDRSPGSERGDLGAGEAKPAGPCAGKPEGALGCSFDAADPIGRAGVCQGGSFLLRRHCFAEAPCANGLCTPAAIDDCTACAAGTFCAGFLNAGKIRTSCVTPSKNGTGAAGAPCTAGESCRTGHCTAAGSCYQPCLKLTGQCPTGMSCESTSIREGAGDYGVASCLKAVGGDAGTGPIDLGPPDAKLGPPDAPLSTE